MTEIFLIQGDITEQEVDAIVNPANKWLAGGGGVDGIIHKKAGEKLLEECLKLNGCKTGESKITKGYNLSSKYIIHTVGPMFGYEKGKESQLLESCYESALILANENNLKTIAFPSISTGSYRYPIEQASEIALKTIKKYIDKNSDHFKKIILVSYNDNSYKIYNDKIKLIFS